MIPKNQFTSQPQYAVQINWSHPSARGLIACGLAPVAYDLVRKELFADPKAAGAAPQGTLVPSPRNALGRAGGTGLFPFSYGQGFRLDTNNKYTALASVVLGGATASQGNAIFSNSAFSSPASADSNGGELFLFNTSQRPLLDVNNTRILNPTSGPQIPLHEQKFVAARIVGGASGTYGVWWDGEQKYSGTHTRSISALPVFYIGVRVDPTLRTPRAFQAYWFWNRDLSDAELATLTQNPWQLFSPAQSTKQFYFVSAAGTDALLANDLQSLSQLSSPAVGQKHVLLANDLQSTSSVQTVTLGQKHVLLANDLESTSSVQTVPVGQKHVLLANGLQSLSQLSSPAISGGAGFALLANDLESATQLSIPVLRQKRQVNYATSVTIASLNGVTFYHNGGKWYGY